MQDNKFTVFYHQGCTDGVAAAWVFYHFLDRSVKDALAQQGGMCRYVDSPPEERQSRDFKFDLNLPIFIGIRHDCKFENEEYYTDRRVYFVDIAHNAQTIRDMAAKATSVTILDHHKSNVTLVNDLKDVSNVFITFDMNRSGCQIAWDWYVNKYSVLPDEIKNTRPMLLDYIGDRDLWQWKMPNSKHVNKTIHIDYVTQSFPYFDKYCMAFDAEKAALTGEAYQKYDDTNIGRAIGGANKCTIKVDNTFEGAPPSLLPEYNVLLVHSTVLSSEIGDVAMKQLTDSDPKIHFAIIYRYSIRSDEWWFSCRTTRDDVDLSIICKHVIGVISGGGHPKASGFTLKGSTHLRDVFQFISKEVDQQPVEPFS